LAVCIDLFAGPGGLAEGFSQAGFDIAISIEKEKVECETLQLRKLHKLLILDGEFGAALMLASGEMDFFSAQEKFPKLSSIAQEQVKQLELGTVSFSKVYSAIRKSLNDSGKDNLVLLGGPPCQAYSIVGRSRNIGKSKVSQNPSAVEDFYKDARHTLYREYLKVLSTFAPDIFIMENVKGILSARTGIGASKGSVISNIISDLETPGRAMAADAEFLKEVSELDAKISSSEYILVPLVRKSSVDRFSSVDNQVKPSDFLIRSEEHGIPQTRHRVIICGIRKDVYAKRERLEQLERKEKKTTVREVLGSFPALRSDITKENLSAEKWAGRVADEIRALTTIADVTVVTGATTKKNPRKAAVKNNRDMSVFLEDSLGPIMSHRTRKHMISDLARYYFCADFAEREGRSPKIQDWPIGKLIPNHKDIRKEGNRVTVAGFSDRFKVQVWDKPASTITSHISKDGHHFIHPDKTQCRSLSVREAARIQTFPDSYQFCGGISKQFHQVGNAVPPYLAYQIANLLSEYLDSNK
jgi:DNA (cytosine-5)-methyltransferase 1